MNRRGLKGLTRRLRRGLRLPMKTTRHTGRFLPAMWSTPITAASGWVWR
jgi:hypothetical protein